MGAPQYEQAGADIGGTGTTNTIPRWTGPSTLGDSGITDNGTVIGVANGTRTLAFNLLQISGNTLTTSTAELALQYATSRDTTVYAPGSSIALIVKGTTGYVGIGTASPNAILSVYNAGTPTISLWNSSNFTRFSTNTNDCFIDVGLGGTAGALIFRRSSSATESARIDSSGNLILNTANTAATIQAAGSQQGLKLPNAPGNTEPNTLDCYADGGTVNSGGVTWTPALRFGGATTGITGSQVGRYTRIGNMVFAQGTIALSSKGSATGAASIAGLPTSANVAATIYYSIAIGYNSKVTFTGQLHGLISVNSGIVELYQTSTAGVVSAITNTDFAADSVLTFTVCYPVT